MPRCLESLVGLVDTVVIIDTGSTDATIEVARQTCELLNLSLQLTQRPWVDFGHNRTELVEFASQYADYLLLLDADMVANWETKPVLTADSYLIRYTGDLDYRQKLLVSTRKAWSYIGKTHEYITCPVPEVEERLDDLTITHYADGGSRADKTNRDLLLLHQELQENPNDPRTVFYLATSYEDAGLVDRAISSYALRASLTDSWEEERWLAQMRAAALSRDVAGLLMAYEARPSRAESLYNLANMARLDRNYRLAAMYAEAGLKIPYPHDDILFVEAWVYQWGLKFEASIAAWWNADYVRFVELSTELVNDDNLPLNIRSAVIRNLEFLPDSPEPEEALVNSR